MAQCITVVAFTSGHYYLGFVNFLLKMYLQLLIPVEQSAHYFLGNVQSFTEFICLGLVVVDQRLL